jgi:hypothetical protein
MAALQDEVAGMLSEISTKISQLNEEPSTHMRDIVVSLEEAVEGVRTAIGAIPR